MWGSHGIKGRASPPTGPQDPVGPVGPCCCWFLQPALSLLWTHSKCLWWQLQVLQTKTDLSNQTLHLLPAASSAVRWSGVRAANRTSAGFWREPTLKQLLRAAPDEKGASVCHMVGADDGDIVLPVMEPCMSELIPLISATAKLSVRFQTSDKPSSGLKKHGKTSVSS